MNKYLSRNRKGLSTLSLIILLLIAAIFGGIVSYLWVTGYYVSLKQNIPTQDTVAITNMIFNPKNASAFNVTVLNPSYSPDNYVTLSGIGYQGAAEATMHFVTTTEPSLSITPIQRGTSQNFTCIGNLAPYVNSTVRVSAFVVNGSGSTNILKIPYTQLLVSSLDFSPKLGVKNFTITVENAPQSATTLNVTAVGIDYPAEPLINTTRITPALPQVLAPNKTLTLTIGDWSSYATAGGPHNVTVLTEEGYTAGPLNTTIPKLALSVQSINFNVTDTQHFKVTLRNNGSTDTPLNVSAISLLLNGTTSNVTPALNGTTNGVLGNSTATFTVPWNWTNHRNTYVIVTATMLQGISASGSQTTSPNAILSMAGPPTFPDLQHVLVTVRNSPTYSLKEANITSITVTLDNGTTKTLSIVQPTTPPNLVGIGDVTMLKASWNWANYVNRTVTVNVYTNETFVVSYATRTPTSVANYSVFLTIPSAPTFSSADTVHFNVTVDNGPSSSASANVTRITVLLVNGTEIASNFTSQTIAPSANATFVCSWNWSTYRSQGIVVRIYTGSVLRTIYVTKTS